MFFFALPVLLFGTGTGITPLIPGQQGPSGETAWPNLQTLDAPGDCLRPGLGNRTHPRYDLLHTGGKARRSLPYKYT